jgi:TRAP transporter TAXI family solute receptor
LALFLAATACTAPRADGVARANLVTGSTGSSWYSIGSAVADRTNRLLGGHPLNAVPGAGGISNPARLAHMPGDIGISFASFLRAAYRGEPPYRQAYPALRHVATLIENKLHLVMADTLDASDMGDIVRRRIPVRIGTGPPGSGEEFLVRELLAHYGATYDDLRSWGGRIDLLGTGERADAWRDGHVDLIAFSINDPAPVVSELLTVRAGRLVPVEDGARAALGQRWHALPRSIRARTYPGQLDDVATVGLAAVLFTTSDVAEPLVYAVTRAVAENKAYLETVHAGFKSWDPAMMAASDVPLHPGAARYYAEKRAAAR